MNNFLKQSWAGLRILLALTVLLGVLYPLSVWGVSRIPGLHANAEATDTTLVAVAREGDQYFVPRPSAATLPASGGSNKGELNEDYTSVIAERRTAVAQREGVPESQVPQDAVTASASGLDPHISPEYAALQVPRVARASGLSVEKVRELVAANTHGTFTTTVNVTALNRAIDSAS
ncbi:potassium-transporting ATPase subunit C [Lentzea flaviverrucosa]|uniref:K+-transporting ATPase ATPase C chain n=1 Tax=Lentzea flaviverrucosa TaxID=200379 RepID=A0A1H9G214_9PSEU|nr:potassium-transporting ATPase subunit C [Lentzea flaviverrucosa]RDI35038.1 K+-transporting ATPase ATPase C chain [Lentzea flaviverrucosa]SEQ43993.1 K+-transporting ATPase ATPase C chain [Lentzea flaviverrucosa]